MVLKGAIRSNAVQLSEYLLRQADNDNKPYVLEIRGTSQPENLKNSLIEMDVSGWITRTKKTLYHAQICPDISASQKMTPEDWCRAADVIEKELGFTGQRRVLVMHTKHGRTHCHAVWSREKDGKVIDNRFSRLKQDKARQILEQTLEQQRTPVRNKNRAEMKELLTLLWQQTSTGQGFIRAAKEKGYIIAKGTRRPFMVIDRTGRSFDLVRQLHDVRTKTVREKLEPDYESLPMEKTILQSVRSGEEFDRVQGGGINKITRQREKWEAKDRQQKIVTEKLRNMEATGKNMTDDGQDKNLNASQDKAAEKLKTFREKKTEREQSVPETSRQKQIREVRERLERNRKARRDREQERG